MRLLTMIVLGLAAQFAQAADPVGRIFFTPEQRTQLDSLRTQKAVASRVRNEPVPEVVTYSGIVRSSGGKTTVWINDEALSEVDLRNKASITGSIGRDGRVTLQAPQSAVELKVGQSATLFSGKVEEGFTSKGSESGKAKQAVTETKPTPDPAAKEIPPEVLEALRKAASRAAEKTTPPPSVEESPKPVPNR